MYALQHSPNSHIPTTRAHGLHPAQPRGGVEREAQARHEWLARINPSHLALSRPVPATLISHSHPITETHLDRMARSRQEFHEHLISQRNRPSLLAPPTSSPRRDSFLESPEHPGGGRETSNNARPFARRASIHFREALDEERQPLEDDDGHPIYLDAAGNYVRSHRVEGRMNHMRQTQDPDRIYHRINGTYTLHSPSSSSAEIPLRFHTIETRRQKALQVLNEAIDAGPDRTEKTIVYEAKPFDHYPRHGYLHRLNRSHILKLTPDHRIH
ncbi:hypothetical protein JCM5353_005548 [Sporobolomyces roseus]